MENKTMKEKFKFLKSPIAKICLLVVVVVIGFVVSQKLEEKQQEKEEQRRLSQRNIVYAENVDEDNKILQAFMKHTPEAEIYVACEEDITDDGCKDLVVIYKKGKLTRTVVAIDSGDGENYTFTDPIPGPIENQKVQFKNIDKEGVIEFIITGEKNGAVGYAVYRMIDGIPTDLFGEGMDDCC